MKGEGEQGSETANHRKKKNSGSGFSFRAYIWSIYHRYLCYHKLHQHLVVCVCVCVTGQAHFSQSVGWVISPLNVTPLTSLFKG